LGEVNLLVDPSSSVYNLNSANLGLIYTKLFFLYKYHFPIWIRDHGFDPILHAFSAPNKLFII